MNGGFNKDEGIGIGNKGYELGYLWKERKMRGVGRFGLGSKVGVSWNVLFKIEVNGKVVWDKLNWKKGGNVEWEFNGVGGFRIKFGKR